MSEPNGIRGGEAGFSLFELLIAMGVTMILMTMASGLLARCINIRTGEDARTDSLADVQRALNIISREAATAGYGLSSNGVVGCNGGACDSDRTSLRIRSNLDGSANGTQQEGEDVKFFTNDADDTTYLVRYDANAPINQGSVLANRVDEVQFFYYDRQVNYNTVAYDPANPTAPLITNVRGPNGALVAEVNPTQASYLVIIVAVRLPAIGLPNTEGYQPPKTEMLASDVALRNSGLTTY